MKPSKFIVTALLAALMLGGWCACLLGIGMPETETAEDDYDLTIALAEDYMQRGLYQKAIAEYEAAVSMENREEDWQAILDAYVLSCEEGTSSESEYRSAAISASLACPTNTDFCMLAVSLCEEQSNYTSIYDCLAAVIEAGGANDEITALYYEIRYAYSTGYESWESASALCGGYYVVENDGAAGLADSGGSQAVACTLDTCSPVGDDEVYVCAKDGSGFIMDLDGIVQGKLSFAPSDAGVYSQGFVAVQNGDTYSYYDVLGDEQFGSYISAGSFQDGKAAVRNADGWVIIDTNGNIVSDNVYDDIILNADGSYLKNGVMLAKKDGAYHIYDEEEQQVGSLSCDSVDCQTDSTSYIAFERDGLWGFADLSGNEVIAPVYSGAKSFSAGLAAVYNGETWGFIAENGDVVIDYVFEEAYYFDSDGSCMVKTAEGVYKLITLDIVEK